MKVIFVYILECSDKSYYIGLTGNLKRRYQEHNNSKYPNSYTSYRLPVKILYFERYDSFYNAFKRERQLKGWSRLKKEMLMNYQFKFLSIISKKNFRTPPSIQF